MPSDTPIYALTLRGQVMHDLGVDFAGTGRTPTLAGARRYAAAHGATHGISPDVIEDVARQALRDWRATQLAHGLETARPEAEVREAYTSGRAGVQTVGVRVQLELHFDSPPAPGIRHTASVLVNVSGRTSIQAAVAAAIAAWNAEQVEVRHGHASGGRAVGGSIVQLVEDGFPQAQIEA